MHTVLSLPLRNRVSSLWMWTSAVLRRKFADALPELAVLWRATPLLRPATRTTDCIDVHGALHAWDWEDKHLRGIQSCPSAWPDRVSTQRHRIRPGPLWVTGEVISLLPKRGGLLGCSHPVFAASSQGLRVCAPDERAEDDVVKSWWYPRVQKEQ